MTYREPTRATTRMNLRFLRYLCVAGAILGIVWVYTLVVPPAPPPTATALLAPPTVTAIWPRTAPRTATATATATLTMSPTATRTATTSATATLPPTAPPTAASPSAVLRRAHRGALGAADGVVPAGTTVFADALPGVAQLDPALLAALRQAATDAAADGIVFLVTSGWRSPAYQEQLLQEAVTQYGSEAEAARWVATPATSAHVAGKAVDLGPVAATAWLAVHGAAYGLCQIYRNEAWHYELRPAAIAHRCPPLYADPTHDPRMQP
jgi:LAS superfamily LD-carboxypeptidase LdcB